MAKRLRSLLAAILFMACVLPGSSLAAPPGAVAVSAGGSYSLALNDQGLVFEWGNAPEMDPGPSPVLVPGLTDVKQIAANYDLQVALKKDGTVWVWGTTDVDLMGSGGDKFLSLTPVQVPGIRGVKAVAAGMSRFLAILEDGTLWGSHGIVKWDGSGASWKPGPVAGLTNVKQVALGDMHFLALKDDGTVWAWGSNFMGQIGPNFQGIFAETPVQVPGLVNIEQVAAGASHNLALVKGGTVWAWGGNMGGQIGLGPLPANATDEQRMAHLIAEPTLVKGINDAVAVAAAAQHSLALRADGTVLAWGANDRGQLGDGSLQLQTSPVAVAGLTDVVQVSAGIAHSLARRSDGSIWAWGEGKFRSIGDGDNQDRPRPVLVSLPAVAAPAPVQVIKFSDTAGHWAELSIGRAAEIGLVGGYPDGTFNPDGTLTRAAFVKMIVRALNLPSVVPQTPTFPDTAGHWVVTQGFMEAAVQAGLVTTAEFGGRFDPDKAITREEIAVMAARALGEKPDDWERYAIAGTDAAEITPWRAPYASAVQYLKIITGFPDGSFRPKETATRAQAAVIVLRVVDYRAAHP